MSKICTSIDQCKKLIELGIDVNTANMIYQPTMDIDSMKNVGFDKTPLCIPFNEVKECNVQYLPAWSLSALLELIPTSIDEYTEDFSQLELTKQSVSYVYAMGNLRKGFLKDNLLDSVFEMVIWLKENNKL